MSNKVAWDEAYLHVLYHLDPSSRLATINMGHVSGVITLPQPIHDVKFWSTVTAGFLAADLLPEPLLSLEVPSLLGLLTTVPLTTAITVTFDK